ncbi:hypothetical protein [Plantibacter sp. CFBP 8775]|uniref:hypothetical protein n=1 Tax=Plantibacter sp. CFBP 8775 TaxID=2774038 RepID=UPI00178073C6|nr:hypothetical protein [Plantibacter sp. CFBP 8775]MBD8103988.1 hypothetical protein [Plantibacter sp. CFBP 8775]
MDVTPEQADYLRNPAGQLFLFLEHTLDSAMHNQPIRQVWASYFAVEPEDQRLLLQLGRALTLPDEVERDVRALRNTAAPKEMLLGPLPQARAALSFVGRLDVPLHQVQSQFDRGTTRSLSFVSHFLNPTEPHFPPNGSVETIRALAEKLREEVMSVEGMDPSVARLLLEYVHRMLHALDDVALFGAATVVGETDRLTGQFVRSPQVVVEISKSKRVWAAVQKVMVASAVVSAGVSGPLQLLPDAQAALKPLLQLVSGSEQPDTDPEAVDEADADIAE